MLRLETSRKRGVTGKIQEMFHSEILPKPAWENNKSGSKITKSLIEELEKKLIREHNSVLQKTEGNESVFGSVETTFLLGAVSLIVFICESGAQRNLADRVHV